MSILTPDFQIIINGKDVSPKIRPRLVNFDIKEFSGEQVDTLNITLDDTDNRLSIPDINGLIEIKIGFKGQPLVNKGKFVFENLHYIDPPRQVTIIAHAAAVESVIKKRQDYAWHDTTLGTILETIADRNNLVARIDPTLAALASGSVHQQNESDLALIQRLAREHDATGVIKNNYLIFIPNGATKTATGKRLSEIIINRSTVTSYDYSVEHVETGAIEAKWHSKKQARYHIVKFGDGTATKRLSNCYHNAESALQAAHAEYNHRRLGKQSLWIFAATGIPELSICQPVKIIGLKPIIDEKNWQVDSINHKIDNKGLTTNFKMVLISLDQE
ncbi:contractile injection system protein, VgrG/Pvc8 family [Zymomonas mobilis]|uniref:Late control D family protein n=1 Tax=Zymomonas mobilis subsp. mobilis (strain ATCC 31821 / ZM4 / CP4) TaxID=264203 RepID=A0A806CG79_ZYMMO|nr:contractile injection system protein, VgrG/Pvc8 family [Zymomonas mobilis]ADC33788.1 late control D family protein [Zymomonas mobilis subsp. mobilis ZM4 = ATCC 31821]AHB11058.1 phage protein D [Zymomonas mobilis subsp. mobilis str. CP4 = NRRL B-14023]AHJ71425.1 Phage protein D [Zymomonas mobilis subsp. mobilis NRRL B-12526]AHJ73265.1 Phage protein D [Zymomonas mobilis subsp. mobilis str. CP4 = NRRL B-14023]